MISLNHKVDDFIAKNEKWQDEFKLLRKIILECEITEELKWGVPCYTYQNKNIVLIHGFKEYCAVLFVKGVLLKDHKGLLIQQTEHVQAGRQLRFKSVNEINDMTASLKSYIDEAIEIEKMGLDVTYKKNNELIIPEELQKKLDESSDFQVAFEALTPGRQRGYIFYFSEAKQSKTRLARIEKYLPQILIGKGLKD